VAINKNHEFEDLNGIKCAIVERNVSSDRVSFLRELLEFNKYSVVVTASPAAKPSAPTTKQAVASDANSPVVQASPSAESQEQPPTPETFTVGVTDVTFNPTNAIFGRLLKTPGGHVVTLAYWKQKESVSHDEMPYYERNL
jgi:hypothetical protein